MSWAGLDGVSSLLSPDHTEVNPDDMGVSLVCHVGCQSVKIHSCGWSQSSGVALTDTVMDARLHTYAAA